MLGARGALHSAAEGGAAAGGAAQARSLATGSVRPRAGGARAGDPRERRHGDRHGAAGDPADARHLLEPRADQGAGGTKDNPAIVPSFNTSRVVGLETEQGVIWFKLEKGPLHLVDGQYFKLQQLDGGDH